MCGDRLERLPLALEQVGDHVTPSVPCSWQALFGGVGDRVGDGAIVPAAIEGDRSMEPPVIVNAGFAEARIHGRKNDDGDYAVVVRAGDRFVLAEVHSTPGIAPKLVWAGDLDNDHVIDWVIDTPTQRNESHLRLYLTAKQADGRPEQVADSRLQRNP